MNFAERLHSLKIERKLKNTEIAQYAGVSESAVRSWLDGNRVPGITAVARLCEELHISADWLLTGADNISRNVDVSGTVSGNSIVGSSLNSVNMHNGQKRPLSDEIVELIRVYELLDVKRRIELLNKAFALETEKTNEAPPATQ